MPTPAAGWKPIPIDGKSKNPTNKQWQKQPFRPSDFNGNSTNIAVQLGAVSAGLTDVDLDCLDAIGLASDFLPPTGAMFGRRSKPCSHQLYFTDLWKTDKKATLQFCLYEGGKPGAMLVELRVGGGGRGGGVTMPPSLHSVGELVEWVSEGEPARVDGDMLKRAVLRLAVACLLKPRYPGQGSRHQGALVLGGVLARAGWKRD